ncbi:MAG: oxygen-independent coproporphyrinogen III oxidase [Bacteroidales bacterium]|nr:oxygen-independent coproporphyrinogen III oxidase [Bacteroidales bacterium]
MNIDFIKKYETRAPRYTSYPPANFFNNSVDNNVYQQQIEISNGENPQNISLYIHIPFCPRLCNFCGCTTFFNSDINKLNKYIEALEKEIDTVAQLIDLKRPVTQMHWGGGTPNALNFDYIKRIVNRFKKYFKFANNAELAMECNPAYMDLKDIDNYAELGFNRLSIGIQDFDIEVLKNINRQPSKLDISVLINHIHSLGMKGINLDLVYGLPGQTPETFKIAAQKAVDCGADRIVTFPYAHVPWVKPAQKILEQKGLLSADEKLHCFVGAHDILTKAGYNFIGMDHFCKPDDALSIALKNGNLKRNFQGYCTAETTGQVYGFGATSITQLHKSYVQNIKNPDIYIDTINKYGLAVERGYVLSNKEIIVREAINELMCNGKLNFDYCASKLGISVKDIIEATDYKPEKFAQFVNDGILTITNNELKLRQDAFLAVRNIAVLLDPMIKDSGKMFSKTI